MRSSFFFRVVNTLYYGREMTKMSIKKLFTDMIAALALSIVSTIGMLAGLVVMGNGLGEWLETKTKKLFNR